MEDEPRVEHDPEASVGGAGTLHRSEPTSGDDPDLATLVGLEAELADLDADLAQADRSDRASRDADAPVDGGGSADG